MATLAKDKDKAADVVDVEVSLETSKGELAVLADNKSPADKARVAELVKTIDMGVTTSIIGFGTGAQKGLTTQADAMLSGVRNKDTGPAGEVMNGLMVQIRGLGLDSLNPNEKPSFFKKLISKLTPIQKFIQQYESIESQVDAMVKRLNDEKGKLERDVVMLDGMYDEALDFFNELAFYIEAGEVKLEDVRANDIPVLQTKAEETGKMLDAQALRDLTERAMDLERKVHDLQLTRQVTMQLLPQIRMIQDVDKGLVTKIGSSILTTIPLWKSSIAMAITLWNQAGATKAIKAQADATNEMLVKNSALLKENSAAARVEIERGVVDIETIKTVNADLIATIQESIQIAEDGQKRRVSAAADMIVAEQELKNALINADGAVSDALGS